MDDELMSCPYNKSHHIHRSRMSIHLTKCSKAHKGKKRICPLDATHHLDESEYIAHLLTCPNRCLVERARYCFENEVPKGQMVPKYKTEAHPDQLQEASKPTKQIHVKQDWNGLAPQPKEPCCLQPECSLPRDSPPIEENWDHLVGKVKYDPEKQSELKPVLRTPQGKTKTERKKFRQEERMRYTTLTNTYRTLS